MKLKFTNHFTTQESILCGGAFTILTSAAIYASFALGTPLPLVGVAILAGLMSVAFIERE